ncbi:MAG: prepilin peptidase [Clostridia bacterium]|nr:prepilin peptidase [Clostridia bacterium]
MIAVFGVVILFFMGIYFGSFFTLATYRLPKKENITHKHSYCPNCNHKLGIFDLVPVFSFLRLGGKCRYCKHPIGIRYFLFEILTGIVFVLFGLSLKIDIYSLSIENMLYVSLGILYITSLFLLAGIDKEQHKIEKSVLYYQVFVSILYIIYSCTFQNGNVYQYGIYLCIMSILILYETFSFRKNLKENNIFLIFIFILNMVIVTKEYIAIMTLLCTILSIGFENIIAYMKRPKSQKMIEKKRKTPIIFYLSVANIIMVIGNHFLINYMMK